MTLNDAVKQYALSKGFDIVGFTGAEDFTEDELAALKRVRDGHMDGYSWYTEARIRKMNRPKELLEGARSVISLATSYLGDDPDSTNGMKGRIARYSWGDDYHNVLKGRLKEFCDGLPAIVGRSVRHRIFVDDGPMNDRAAARRSGVGWFGKNTNILTPSHGSWVLLGQVITDLELEPDNPLKKTCGSCVRCIDDCPTGAIVAPYVVDNTRCISYLTIELRGTVPRNLRPLMGDWIFGCDICQDVCPVNIKAVSGDTAEFQQRTGFWTPDLVPILEMDQETFSKKYRNSPIKRAKLSGLQRNACIALGNNGDPRAIQPLTNVLLESEPLVRSHAAWALGQIGGPEAVGALRMALNSETESNVTQEIEDALSDALGEKFGR